MRGHAADKQKWGVGRSEKMEDGFLYFIYWFI